MPKLILRSNYFKNEPANHKSNYIKYLGTREGVEMNPDTLPRFFYEDLDMHGRKENFIEYISDRPGAVPVGGTHHGLFSDRGLDINLEQVMDEVANHPGIVWINVISLKREDAARLGFDNVERWQQLLRSHYADIAEAFKIDTSHFNWYAAFHNEGHHPHVHMVVYSKGMNGYEKGHEGFMTKKSIGKLKSVLLRDIFKDELTNLYSQKTDQRQLVKEQARNSLLFSLGKLSAKADSISSDAQATNIESMIHELGQRLSHITGKKVYGYLHKNIKERVDAIFAELEKLPEIKEVYEKWCDYQKAIGSYYRDNVPGSVPLSKNEEFKSIKNMIIKMAIEAEKNEQRLSKNNSGMYAAGTNGTSSGGASGDNVFGGGSDAGSDMPTVVGRLLKKIEQLFNQKADGQANQGVSESLQKQKEKEKKMALGQKSDDHEVFENKSYMSMG